MKIYIRLVGLVLVSGNVFCSQSPECLKKVQFASDATIVDSPVATRSSSGSDASAASLSPKSQLSLKDESFFYPKGDIVKEYYRRFHVSILTEEDKKPLQGTVLSDPKAKLDPLTGCLDSSLSPDEYRDIKHQVTKDSLARKAPWYKQCLVVLGCTPHLKP